MYFPCCTHTENKITISLNLYVILPYIFLLKLKLQHFGHLCEELTHWKRPRWWDATNNSMNMSVSKLWEAEEDRGAWRAAVQGVANSWTRPIDCTTAAIPPQIYSLCL